MSDLKLEVGRSYLTRKAERVHIVKRTVFDGVELFHTRNDLSYHSDGTINVAAEGRWIADEDLVCEAEDSLATRFYKTFRTHRHGVNTSVVVGSAIVLIVLTFTVLARI